MVIAVKLPPPPSPYKSIKCRGYLYKKIYSNQIAAEKATFLTDGQMDGQMHTNRQTHISFNLTWITLRGQPPIFLDGTPFFLKF